MVTMSLTPPPLQDDDDIIYLPDLDRQNIIAQQTESLFSDWIDRLISDPNETAYFVLDSAKKESWQALKEEVNHIRSSLQLLLPHRNQNDASPVSLKEILMLVFGPNSDFATAFCNEVEID